ncbi:hypothetical protein Q2T40_17195 [Winogradskyella maritima]|uniref:Transmembrane protein n=1 Tax=Winogradskyella maritima TaxID=1517766 RepID=A0ABV8AEZ5_9FLAO|nr:hypothetical protein [Winogradskyella maritima]
MNVILKSISYIFHPIVMPLLGVIYYFHKTRLFIPQELMYAKLFSVFILTFLLPILMYFLLKTIKKVETIHLSSTKERIIPLLVNAIIIAMIAIKVFPYDEVLELYYFFIGILCSTVACLILALLKVKASIHMLAVCGFFMFAVAVGIHFQININGTIALMMLVIGAVATSRLHLKAHTNSELIIGAFLGLFPQLLLLNYWL